MPGRISSSAGGGSTAFLGESSGAAKADARSPFPPAVKRWLGRPDVSCSDGVLSLRTEGTGYCPADSCGQFVEPFE
jgi:hypothetical protein